MADSTDLELLQGTWKIVAFEMQGYTASAAILSEARIVISENRFVSTGMGAVYEGILTLDSSATPKSLTMHFDTGPEKGNTNLAIYELSGDTWRLCLAMQGPTRPTEFAANAPGIALETLKRSIQLSA